MGKNGKRIGLALSGGGYRAAAYHLETLRALHKMDLLEKVDVISSVSGGSIIAAFYLLHKDEPFEQIEQSFRKCLAHSSLWGAILNLAIVFLLPALLGIFVSGWCLFLYLLLYWGFYLIPSSKWIALYYDRLFFGKKKLKDLPDSPIAGINSTNVATGRLFTFSKQDVGGYDYKENGRSSIKGEEIPISFAVASSTCVPSIFSPTQIAKRYYEEGKYKDTLLVDGGLYDNQGAYILTESTNKLYRVENVVISDAGNTRPDIKGVRNTICLMLQSIEILMNRIRTIQIRTNIYNRTKKNSAYYAYVSLLWSEWNSMVDRFMDNIKKENVPELVLSAHRISLDDVIAFREKNDQNAKFRIEECFKKSIGWQVLLDSAPSKELHEIALSVGTNLTPLSKRKIDALSAHSEWLTELQIKTYLPHLLH